MTCAHPVTGSSTCHCAGCHETFTSPSAFDLHQRIGDDGLTCLDPEYMLKRDETVPVFAVVRWTPDGRPVWGSYRPDLPQFNERAGISGPNTGALVSSPTPEREVA